METVEPEEMYHGPSFMGEACGDVFQACFGEKLLRNMNMLSLKLSFYCIKWYQVGYPPMIYIPKNYLEYLPTNQPTPILMFFLSSYRLRVCFIARYMDITWHTVARYMDRYMDITWYFCGLTNHHLVLFDPYNMPPPPGHHWVIQITHCAQDRTCIGRSPRRWEMEGCTGVVEPNFLWTHFVRREITYVYQASPKL